MKRTIKNYRIRKGLKYRDSLRRQGLSEGQVFVRLRLAGFSYNAVKFCFDLDVAL